MAKITKKQVSEREYIVPLRRSWLKVPKHRRAKRASRELKEFLAKHMRVPDRDIRKIKLDKWLNQEIWFRGIKKPPAKIRVKAKRDGENIKVTLASIPEAIKFRVEKEAKIAEQEKKKAEEKKKARKAEEEKKEEKPEQEKKEEEEKHEAVKEAGKIQADEKHKEVKHQAAGKQEPKHPVRKALKK
jgi:large subunit ribosomal protein L31e